MIGRMAGSMPGEEYPLLIKIALEAGNGDILEIGSLYGGSALAMMIARKEAGIDGKIYCVDLFGNYHEDSLSTDVIIENFYKFGVIENLRLIVSNSNKIPELFKDERFVITHIDGDHKGDAPLNDWRNTKDLTTKFVVFHDANKDHPDVLRAIKAANNDPDWFQYIQETNTIVMERNQ